MSQPFLGLLADIGIEGIIQFLIFLVMVGGAILAQLFSKKNEQPEAPAGPERPVGQPERLDARGQRAPGGQRPGQQRPPQQRPSTKQRPQPQRGQPQRAAAPRSKETRRLAEQPIDAVLAPAGVDQADNMMDAHLQSMFDQRLGSLSESRTSRVEEDVLATERARVGRKSAAAQIAAVLREPASVRQAFVLAEILRPRDDL